MIVPACQALECLALLWGGFTTQLQQPAHIGYLSAYGEMPTVATLAYRQEIGDIPSDISQYSVFLAVADCGLIGREATLISSSGVFDALIIDCAGNDGTPEWMEQNSIVAEIDFYTWAAYPELVGSAAVLVMGDE